MTYEILQLKLWSQNIWRFFYIVLFLYKCVGMCNIFKFQILLAVCFSVSMFISILIFFLKLKIKKIKTTIKINIDIFFPVFLWQFVRLCVHKSRICPQALYMYTSQWRILNHAATCTIYWRHNRNWETGQTDNDWSSWTCTIKWYNSTIVLQ